MCGRNCTGCGGVHESHLLGGRMSTLVLLGPDGQTKTLTMGSRLEPVDLSTLDQGVVAKVEQAAALANDADKKRDQVETLLTEIAALQTKVRRAKVRFK